MPTITLDSLRTAVEAKYGPVIIDLGDAGEVHLIQALRLPKERRAELVAKQNEFNAMQRELEAAGDDGGETAADTEDRTVEHLHNMIRLVARSHDEADRLLEVVGGDLALLMEVFRTYSESSELGEA